MQTRRAFTIIELLVVVSIIALLVGILLPAIGKARDQAKVSISQANLRNLSTAHQTYASEWNDRQFTLVDDNIASYGGYPQAFSAYWQSHGGEQYAPDEERRESTQHPPVYLGWGYHHRENRFRMMAYRTGRNCANATLTLPIEFSGQGCNPALKYFGAFRLANCQQFHQYVSGKFYDKVFYAPKDTVVFEAAQPCFESPDEYCDLARVDANMGEIPAWTSYVLSPAAMFSPAVMRHVDPNDPLGRGFQIPWSMPGGFRSPGFSQGLYPALKTHMLEHHWLQNNSVAECNPGFAPGTYGRPVGCEPYYFNHAWESSPMTLFYDGHVEGLGVRNTMRADGRMRTQTGHENWGLWSKDTPFGDDGYLSEYGYDQAETSFHILTTDGIRGRDIVGD